MNVWNPESIDNGIGYVYPPFNCENCGWCECCEFYDTESCDPICDMYETCYKDGVEVLQQI